MNKQSDTRHPRPGGAALALATLGVSMIMIHTGCATRQAGAQLPVDTRLVLLTPEQALAYAGREQLRETAARAWPEDRLNTRSDRLGEKVDTPQEGSSRRPARVRVLHVGRSIDPVDPRLMHEAHTVYILDEDEAWELQARDGKLRPPGENPPSRPSSPAAEGR